MSISIKTGNPAFDNLPKIIVDFLKQDIFEVCIDGEKIRGYRTPDAISLWIRDYSDMMRAVKYIEPDMQSAVTHFAETQADSGRIFDYFTTFPEKLPSERENWTKYVRVPVEADVEFRFVKAAWLAWQATEDDAWIFRLMPKMEKALGYILNHPWRWDKTHNLVKRAYTIDTWDFAYTAGKHDWLQFQIDDNTFWGIMHGDNSGYYEAFRMMEALYAHFNNQSKSAEWAQRAEELKSAMNKVCWNGNFYTHFVKLNPVTIPGVDESRQLSLSNPMDINRGTTDREMARSILREYRSRWEKSNSFAEWFSIDPPFPDGIFGDEKIIGGAYANGGIMPLVGGELAKAAFDNGFEAYGADILKRYYQMVSKRGETFLWYFPSGEAASLETSTSPDAQPTDAWGSSAMLYALIEGLAGITDLGSGFKNVRLSPRWKEVGVDSAEVELSYAASGKKIAYKYEVEDGMAKLDVECDGDVNIIV